MGARWRMPVFGLGLGVAICVLAAIAGQAILGLGLFAIMAIYSAIVLAFGERTATVPGPDEIGDERLPLLTLLAIATAGFVAILVARPASWAASRSCSTAAPARTSAARRRRCSSRSRASAASRASKPPFPAISGLYASPTPDQQRRDDLPRCPYVMPARRRESTRRSDTARTPPGRAVFSLSGNVANGQATSSSRTGSDAAQADL